MDFTGRIETKIILIDGEQLADLMLDYGAGVATQSVYEAMRIDSDYFSEE